MSAISIPTLPTLPLPSRKVAAGNRFFAALTQNGDVYAWGDNCIRVTGAGDVGANGIYYPTQLPIGDKLAWVKPGATGDFAGNVYVIRWINRPGDYSNYYWYLYKGLGSPSVPLYQLSPGRAPLWDSGHNAYEFSKLPVRKYVDWAGESGVYPDPAWGTVPGGGGGSAPDTALVSGQGDIPLEARSGVVEIAAGANHVLAITQAGKVIAWGDNSYGQCDVPVSAQSGAVAIAGGFGFSIALKNDGSVVHWGKLSGWAAGSPHTGPIPLVIPENATNIVAIAASGEIFAFLRNDGKVLGGGISNPLDPRTYPPELSARLYSGPGTGVPSQSLGGYGQYPHINGFPTQTFESNGTYKSVSCAGNGIYSDSNRVYGISLASSNLEVLGTDSRVPGGQDLWQYVENSVPDSTKTNLKSIERDWTLSNSKDLRCIWGRQGLPSRVSSNIEKFAFYGGGNRGASPFNYGTGIAVKADQSIVCWGWDSSSADRSITGFDNRDYPAPNCLKIPVDLLVLQWESSPSSLIRSSPLALTAKAGVNLNQMLPGGRSASELRTLLGLEIASFPCVYRLFVWGGIHDGFQAADRLSGVPPQYNYFPKLLWSSGNLPSGLSILSPNQGFGNDQLGVLDGAPFSVGDSSFAVQVQRQDYSGSDPVALRVLEATVNLSVSPGPPSLGGWYRELTSKFGEPFSQFLTLTNSLNRPASQWHLPGPGRYGRDNGGGDVFLQAAALLPPGLSLNTATGLISGNISALSIDSRLSVPPAPPLPEGVVGRFRTWAYASGSGGVGGVTELNFLFTSGAPIIEPGQSITAKVGEELFFTPVLRDPANRLVDSWSAQNLPAGLSINSNTGAITGVPIETAITPISVSVTASGPEGSDTKAISLTVGYGAPRILSLNYIAQVGSAFGPSNVVLQDIVNRPLGGLGRFTASGLPDGLSLDRITGVMSGFPTVRGNFSTVVTVLGIGGEGQGSIQFRIAQGSPLIEEVQGPIAAVVGVVFSRRFVLINGANRPSDSWSATGLPSWMHLNTATGELSGTPLTVATHTFQITATNAAGSDTKTVSIVVAAGPPVIARGQRIAGKVGVPMSGQIAHETGGAPIPEWNHSEEAVAGLFNGMPPGIDINVGRIVGTPTRRGTFTAQVWAVGAFASERVDVIFEIEAGAPIITSGQTITRGVGVAFSATVEFANDGSRPVSAWSWSQSPPWAAINVSTGEITGTPPAEGFWAVTVTATGPGGSDTKTVLISIVGRPVIKLNQVIHGSVEEPINAILEIEGAAVNPPTNPDSTQVITWPDRHMIYGGGPFHIYRFAVGGSRPYITPRLPSGINFDQRTGAFSGTAEHVGSFTCYIRASGPGGQSIGDVVSPVLQDSGVIGYTAVRFEIAPGAPILNTPPQPYGISWSSVLNKVGLPFQGSFNSAGGLRPQDWAWGSAENQRLWKYDAAARPVASWSAVGLPPGLTMAAGDGLISGTATESGTFNVTITAEGPGGRATVTAAIAIAVGAPLHRCSLPGVNCSGIPGRVGEAFNTRWLGDFNSGLENREHRPATSWAISAGPDPLPSLRRLPDGLTLSADSGLLSGTPSLRGNFSVRVTPSGPGGQGQIFNQRFQIFGGKPIILAGQAAAGVVGLPFGASFQVQDPANRPVTGWRVSGLPAWASMSEAGLISGTPSSVGAHVITLTAIGDIRGGDNAGGTSDPVTATITISAGPPIIDPGQSFTGKVGEFFQPVTLAIQDPVNRTPSSWSLQGGTSLPPGLEINASTGVIRGEPTALGTFTTSIRATNQAGQSTVSVVFTIAPGAPRLVEETIGGAVGLRFSRVVGRVDPANRPITGFEIVGTKPSWLDFDPSTGKFSGTPTQMGEVSFTIKATGPGGESTATIKILVGAGVAYWELSDAATGKVYLRTASSNFLISNLEPAKAYTFHLRAWNGGGASAPQTIQVTTQAVTARAATADRLRLLPATAKVASSGETLAPPASVASPDAFMKNLWVKKTSQASAQFSANTAAFGNGFLRAEDLLEADWALEGLPASQYDRSGEKILLTEGVPLTKIRHETPNFVAGFGGEYIDGRLRQTILHARISTNDSLPAQWLSEAYLLPGARFRLHVLFYTNMFNTILRVGGPTLHFGSYQLPHSLRAQEARAGWGLRQLMNPDGSASFVRTVIDAGEDEHVVFSIRNIGGMPETQTSLIVVAER